jgi:tRNA-2-methylthio-N6-dimethylallyladenosine synthase
MNEHDSQRIFQLLYPAYEPTDNPADADLILLNTCSIREKAENKVYSMAGRFRKLKEQKKDLILGIGGCVAQQEGERLLQKLPYVDLVFGPQTLYSLPSLLQEAEKGHRVCRTELRQDFHIPTLTTHTPNAHPFQRFITIMQGCDNFCSYCVVPYVRGREISRPMEDILAEVKEAVRQGVKEVTLLGQNVNSYGKKEGRANFAQLLRAVADCGVDRLRFMTSHPKDLTEELMRCFVEIHCLCEHLHLPVQSGSTRILKAMNRRYTREEYLNKINKLREICPDIAISTDLIVGFPGETEEDFQETLSLLQEVEYDQLFVFNYSPRPFTRAAQLPDQLPLELKTNRLTQVVNMQHEISQRRHRRFMGRTLEVMVDGVSTKDSSEMAGRTRGNHVVNFKGSNKLIGQTVHITITDAFCHSLRGELAASYKS